MKNFLKNNWILIVILIFAAVLRLWHFGTIPPGLTQDEAALGYNAYSILKTGKDEYGKVLPVIFKSFGDYKPGLYVYMDVPFVATLGLNEVAVRLPSALAGILSVYLIYLLIKEMFPSMENGKWKMEILAAFIAASNPWLIYFSRAAWEANVSLLLTLLGIYFFLRALHSSRFLILSSIFFASTLLTYQGAKLSTAIVVVLLVIIYWRDVFKIGYKYLFTGIILGALISLPIILSLFNGQTGRLDVFSIFSYPRPQNITQQILNEGNEKLGSVSYYLFHSLSLDFARGILWRYFNSFSGRFLFFEGDYQNPQHSAPYQGMLLVTDLIVIIFGMVAMLRQKTGKGMTFLILWLLLSPLPAVLTRDQVQSVRALNMAVPLVIILAFGLDSILKWIEKQKSGLPYYILLMLVYLGGFIYFADAYYVHVPKHDSNFWNYGYKQIVEEITPIQKNYKNIIVEQSFSQPYIYILFYQKYNPANYQKQAKLTASADASDVGLVSKLDNIEFAQIDWSQTRNQHGELVVVDGVTPIPTDLNYTQINKIYFLNGRDLAFEMIQIK